MTIKKETQTKIVEKFQAGTDVAAIAEEHKLSLLTTCRVIVAAGEELPADLEVPDGTRRQRHAARNSEIVALRKAGFSYAMLAEEFSLSAGRIGDICREAKKAAAEQAAA